MPATLLLLTAASVVLALLVSAGWWVAVALVGAVLLLAVHDVVQRRHSILRNYPVLGHMRFLLEKIRPEIQQYFIERNYDGRPFDRDTRSVIYERAKGIHGEKAFGTELDVNEVGYEFVLHSIGARASRTTSSRACASAARTAPSPTTWRCSTSRR